MIISFFYLVPILSCHVTGDTVGLLLFSTLLACYKLPLVYSNKTILQFYTWFIHSVVTMLLFQFETRISFEFVLYLLCYALYTSLGTIAIEEYTTYHHSIYSFLFLLELTTLYYIRYSTFTRML